MPKIGCSPENWRPLLNLSYLDAMPYRGPTPTRSVVRPRLEVGSRPGEARHSSPVALLLSD